MKKKVAIFDIDGTIFRSSLLIELVNILIEKRVFPEKARLEFEKEYLAWLNREGSYHDYIMAIVKVFIKYIKGVPQSKLKKPVELVAKIHKDRTYRYTRNLTQELKRRGYYLLAISHSPKLVLDGFGKHLGFDKIYGIRYEINRAGKFTGKLMDEDLILDKSKILERAVKKENLTLKESVGTGDTESDISFLKMVESPVCFNPNKLLYDEARRRGWKVVVERKDVIYEL